jgi:hypothetical protein
MSKIAVAFFELGQKQMSGGNPLVRARQRVLCPPRYDQVQRRAIPRCEQAVDLSQEQQVSPERFGLVWAGDLEEQYCPIVYVRAKGLW